VTESRRIDRLTPSRSSTRLRGSKIGSESHVPTGDVAANAAAVRCDVALPDYRAVERHEGIDSVAAGWDELADRVGARRGSARAGFLRGSMRSAVGRRLRYSLSGVPAGSPAFCPCCAEDKRSPRRRTGIHLSSDCWPWIPKPEPGLLQRCSRVAAAASRWGVSRRRDSGLLFTGWTRRAILYPFCTHRES
jgi:hypothetical protein